MQDRELRKVKSDLKSAESELEEKELELAKLQDRAKQLQDKAVSPELREKLKIEAAKAITRIVDARKEIETLRKESGAMFRKMGNDIKLQEVASMRHDLQLMAGE